MNCLYETRNLLHNISDTKSEYYKIQNEIKYINYENIFNFIEKIKTYLKGFFIIYASLKSLKILSTFFITGFRISTLLFIAIDCFIYFLIYLLCIYILNKNISFNILKNFMKEKKLSNSEVESISNLNNELEILDLKYQNLNNQLSKSEIPVNYRNLNALNFMISMYESKRGDTLKELINLYEQELRYQEQQRQHEKEMENLRKEIDQAKKSANQAKTKATFANLRSLSKNK